MSFLRLSRISNSNNTNIFKCLISDKSCKRLISGSTRRHVIDQGDKPLPFTSSKANTWKSVNSFGPPDRNAPWYEKYSVIFSTAVFLVYFCILREENDLDEVIYKSLYTQMPGLEEQQIILSIEYNEEHGQDTTALNERLRELRQKHD